MYAEARTRLAAQQASLVLALTGKADLPAGFDAHRLRVARAALTTKRLSAVARAWPALAMALGERFVERFGKFAEVTPMPSAGGPLADGRAFIRWLAGTEALPAEVRLQALAVDLRFRETRAGLVPRRMPTVKALWLSDPRRVVVALRLPWIGERWMSMRLL